MVGTISLSLSQQFDALGNPLSGGLLYFRQAGTVSTPQNAFQDTALTIPHPNPIVLNASGRVPQFYLADGSIKILLTDSRGDTQVTADNILVVGPSSGGGGGGGVDPTTIFSAGDIKTAYGTAVLSGWVRANGRTVGSATSGATERANADTQTLFVYLYGADPNLVVSGGRGASAAADFAANKTIALPDFRGRVLASFDDMGNSPAGRLTLASMTKTTIGGFGGSEINNLAVANLPPLTPAGTITNGAITNGAITNGAITNGAITVTNGGIIVTNGAITSTLGGTFVNGIATGGAGVASGAGGNFGAISVTSTQATTTASQASSSASQAGTTQAGTTQAATTQATSTFAGASMGGTSAVFTINQPTTFVSTYIKL